jgi:hypothetical protein
VVAWRSGGAVVFRGNDGFSVHSGDLRVVLQHGEGVQDVRHHLIDEEGQGWRRSPKRVVAVVF